MGKSQKTLGISAPSQLLSRFYTYFAPLFLLFVVFAAIEYYTDLRLSRGSLKNNETQYVKLADNAITDEVNSVVLDMIFLSKLNEVWDVLDSPEDEYGWLSLAQEILYFSEKKETYEQIKIIDAKGNELIRVNYGDGHPYIVDRASLQNQIDKSYFGKAFGMNIGGIYMSSFESNNDARDNVSQTRPVIRFATPLYASAGKSGILMVSLHADVILNSLTRGAGEISDHVALVNSNGAWLGPPLPARNNQEEQHNFVERYPLAWAEISRKTRGTIHNEDGLFTFDTFVPSSSFSDVYSENNDSATTRKKRQDTSVTQQWKIISHVSPKTLNAHWDTYFHSHWQLYTIVTILIMAISYFLAQSSVRRKSIQEHNEYERRFLSTLENINLAALRINDEGTVLFANPFLLNLLSLKQHELLSKNWFDFIAEDQRPRVQSLYLKMISGHSPPQSTETCLLTQDGGRKYVSWNNTLTHDPSTNVAMLTCIGTDISEQKRLKEEVDARNREIARNQALTAIGEMSSMIAHDLRNPLSSIKMTLQILSKHVNENFSSQSEELSSIALNQVNYMEEIMRDMLQYAKPDAITPDWVCVNDVLNTAINTVQKAVKEFNGDVITLYASHLPRIHADKIKLCQAFSNLLMNALQAAADTGNQPSIVVRTELGYEQGIPLIKIKICDNGPGIDDSNLDKIFDPFFTTRAQGTGLGLPIVKRIIDQHHGKICLEKMHSGNGTCCFVELPTGPIDS
ncbi:MAG: ATP-binding protein [Gammaproteobacteria bacterium]|nr:ATP-binding protein [Gammaproteobacteria bacterium]